MQKKIVISMVVVALLLIGVMATSVVASGIGLASNTAVSKDLTATAESVKAAEVASAKELSPASADSLTPDSVVPEEVPEADLDSLRQLVPNSYDEVDAQIVPIRVRFLLYTNDGKNIMWGYVGNGYFVGQDNLGNRCWGIYGKGVFAGFYDGEFFWGKYNSGNWKATGLFGLNYAYGKYILFPTPDIQPAVAETLP
jgi:hypothetical protein